MPDTKAIDGLVVTGEQGNELVLGENTRFVNSSISIKGKGNQILIQRGCILTNAKLVVESNSNCIQIDSGVRFSGSIIQKIVDGNAVQIGSNTSVGGANLICGEGSSISIGEDCMLAWGIEVRSTDSHVIFDLNTGERINPAANIEIRDHVWIGAKATILKDALIGQGSVVAIGSIVAKRFEEENCVLAGVPARVVRRDIRWERPLVG